MNFVYAMRIAFWQKDWIGILKRYLNELVVPSPNLPIDNVFTPETSKALKDFKYQFRKKNLTSTIAIDDSLEADTWQTIGIALGEKRLKEELENLKDSGLKRLLQGKPEFEYTEAMKACDQKLAEIFGGEGAAVMTLFEPPDLREQDGSFTHKKRPFYREEGHNAIARNDLKMDHQRGGIIHVYTNAQGLPADVGLYVPKGFKQIFQVKDEKGKMLDLKPGANNIQYFYSDTLKIYITFAHAKTKGVGGIGTKKPNGSVKIGNIGGPGGNGQDSGSYIHSHLSFFSEFFGSMNTGTRVDPRNYFCK